MQESLNAFLADFAIEIICPATGHIFKAIFDCPTVDGNLGDYQVESRLPVLICKTIDAAIIKRNTVLIISEREYVVIDNQADGTGFSSLRLE